MKYKVINNTVAFIGGEFFYHFVNFLAGILVARALGSELYGVFSFIFVYLSFFEIFVQFGLNSILTRELSQEPGQAARIVGNAVLLRLVLAALSIPGALFLIQLLHYPLSVQKGILLGSFQLFLTLRAIYETVFRARLLMIYPALCNGARALANLLFVAVMSQFHPTVAFFILAYLGSGLLGLVGIGALSSRLITMDLRPDWNLMKKLIRESAPLLMAGYLTLLYYRIDVFMLSKMRNFSEVGYYGVATRLTEALDVIATALVASLFPLLARSFKEGNRKEFESLVSKAFGGLLLVGLPLALGGSLFARDLVVSLFGPEYSPSGVTLGILFWYTFFGFFSTFLVNLLIACGRQIVDTWVSFFLVLANIGMNLFLIPRFGYNGAAAATVLVEILGFTIMFTYAVRHPKIQLSFPLRELATSLKVGLLFFVTLLVLKGFFQMPVYLWVGLSIFLYGSLLLGFKIVRLQDFRNYFIQWLKVPSEVRP